jgi:phospholipid-binding lipoprotein MlaA
VIKMLRSGARVLVPLALLIGGVSLAGAASSSEEPDRGEIPASGEHDSGCDPLFDDDCDDAAGAQLQFRDPWESYNRAIFRFNGGFDRFILNPITFVYRTILPDPVERALLRVVHNLDSPAILINDGLQLEWRDAGVTLQRFIVNTTVGIAGLFDPAAAIGLERHDSDFGQTLTLAGVRSGPYMILPMLGPTTVRDGSGILADLAMSPLLYLLGPLEIWRYGGSGIALRADSQRDLQTLEQESIDFYAALRSAFYQNRQAEIWRGREHRREQAERDREAS